MLRSLVWRDWVLNRRALVPMIVVFAALQVLLAQLAPQAPALPLFATCLWACLLTLVSFVREEQFRAAAWSCTLPVTRVDLVKARYIGSWLLIVSAALVGFAVAALASGGAVSMAPTVGFDALLLVVALVTPFVALLIPSVTRFGMRGVFVLLLPLNALLPIVFVVSKVTGTQDDVEGTVLAGAVALAGQVGRLRDGLTSPVFYVAVIGLLVLVNWLSYRVTVALFRRREL